MKKGQLLVALNPEDAKLTVQEKEAALENARHAAAVIKSQILLSKETAARTRAEQSKAESTLAVARDTWARMQSLDAGDLAERERVAASNAVVQLSAAVVASRAAARAAEAEIGLQDARLAAAQAVTARAEADLSLARVHLDRTEVRSPMDGMVLKRIVEPGDQLNLLQAHKTAVVSLFDPRKLQVRVDVPLSDVQQIQIGQAVKLSSSAFGARSFDGVVTRITGEADIARNTLQVKVRILSPDDMMRPEMLFRAEFLSVDGSSPQEEKGPTVVVDTGSGSCKPGWKPGPCMGGGSGSSDREVARDTVGAIGRKILVQIVSGLKAGARVVISAP